MHKVCGIFSVILAVVFATVTLGVMPAAAAAKSDDQKRIEREHETKRQADRQKEIDKTNRELDRNRQWRQQHGNDANINQNKLNDRTRDLNAQKQQLERQQREGKEKYLGGQKNSNSGRQGGGQNVAQENQRDAGRYGTFGRQGQGQYQGQQKRDW
jgi:hypothetical protein